MGREQDGKVPRGHVHGPQRCADRLTGFGVSRQVLHPGGAADGQRLLRRGLHVRYLLRYLLRWLLRTLLCAVVFALSARKRIALQCRVRFLLPVVRCLPFFVRVWCQGPA